MTDITISEKVVILGPSTFPVLSFSLHLEKLDCISSISLEGMDAHKKLIFTPGTDIIFRFSTGSSFMLGGTVKSYYGNVFEIPLYIEETTVDDDGIATLVCRSSIVRNLDNAVLGVDFAQPNSLNVDSAIRFASHVAKMEFGSVDGFGCFVDLGSILDYKTTMFEMLKSLNDIVVSDYIYQIGKDGTLLDNPNALFTRRGGIAIDFRSNPPNIINCSRIGTDTITLEKSEIMSRTVPSVRLEEITRKTYRTKESGASATYIDYARERELGRALDGRIAEADENAIGTLYAMAMMDVVMSRVVRDEISCESNALITGVPGVTVVSFGDPYNDSYVLDEIDIVCTEGIARVTGTLNAENEALETSLKRLLGIEEASSNK